MRGSPVHTTEETSNERIASTSVTKKRDSIESVYSGAQQPQSMQKENAGRTAAASVWKR